MNKTIIESLKEPVIPALYKRFTQNLRPFVFLCLSLFFICGNLRSEDRNITKTTGTPIDLSSVSVDDKIIITGDVNLEDGDWAALKALSVTFHLELRTPDTEVPERALAESKIKSVYLENVETIGAFAFILCPSLECIYLPKAITINDFAFQSCTNLITVNLPEAITIKGRAFEACTSLESIHLPKVNTFTDNAFNRCSNLKNVNLPEATEILSGTFYQCNSLENINLPKAETIKNQAFSNCSKLTSIILPEVKTIEAGAFANCPGLKYIELGNTPPQMAADGTSFPGNPLMIVASDITAYTPEVLAYFPVASGAFLKTVETGTSCKALTAPSSLTPELAALGTFQWKKDGTKIDGEESDSYIPTEPGLYELEFTCGGTITLLSVNLKAEEPAITTDLPTDIDICDQDSYTLKVIADGYVSDYTWYKDGIEISGATTNELIITGGGVYQVKVSCFSEAVYSQKTSVVYNESPNIISKLKDMTVSSLPATLEVEAEGSELSYQWYFGKEALEDEVSPTLQTSKEGTYFVVVSNHCGHVESQHINLKIEWEVTLPQIEGITTDLTAGTYNVSNNTDFSFAMWDPEGNSLEHVTVSTDKGNKVTAWPFGNNRIRVTIKNVNAETRILINGTSPVNNESITAGTEIWSNNGMLYINLFSEQEVYIYTPAGTLYDHRQLSKGSNSIPLPKGVYFIRLSDGTTTKILISK